jgi:hypothetical protein
MGSAVFKLLGVLITGILESLNVIQTIATVVRPGYSVRITCICSMGIYRILVYSTGRQPIRGNSPDLNHERDSMIANHTHTHHNEVIIRPGRQLKDNNSTFTKRNNLRILATLKSQKFHGGRIRRYIWSHRWGRRRR